MVDGLLEPSPERTAQSVRDERYASSNVVLFAGSHARGEGTPSSDLDLVVLYERVPHAHRESFTFRGWPVEAFVHDLETLAYFFTEVDRRAGRAVLAQMVLEGRELRAPTPLSRAAKAEARRVLAAGPPPLDGHDLRMARYRITDGYRLDAPTTWRTPTRAG